MLSLSDVHSAEKVVRRHFAPTPFIRAPRLSKLMGADVLLKLECCSPIRVFKIRGALNKIQSLVDSGYSGGVITASAGNHGLAVARAARNVGLPATICVPEAANPQKVELMEAEGATVIRHGTDYQAAFENATSMAAARADLELVHAYDDLHVIAGQGTIALEILSSNLTFDTVLMGVGGGGMIAGVSYVLKTLRPGVKVIGVQPEGASSMFRSLHDGALVTLDGVSTIADGLGARKPGVHTFALAREHVDEVLLVSEADIYAGMRYLLHEERIVAEPAGAAATGALLRYGAERQWGRVAVIVSGANIADKVLAEIMAPAPQQ